MVEFCNRNVFYLGQILLECTQVKTFFCVYCSCEDTKSTERLKSKLSECPDLSRSKSDGTLEGNRGKKYTFFPAGASKSVLNVMRANILER